MKRFFIGFTLALTVLAIPFFLTINHYKEKAKQTPQVNIPINPKIFDENLSKGIPIWMVQQIETDLAFYKEKGITKEMIDELFSKRRISDLNLIRFTIQQGHITFSLSEKNLESRQFRHIYAALKRLNQMTPLPDVDFVISLEDGFTEELGLPLFVYAKSKKVNSLILFPDFKALTGYPRLSEQMEKGSQKHPWEHKLTKAFWRGASTGGWLTKENWNTLGRTKLVLLSLSYPNELDARINGIVQCDKEVPSLIKERGMLGNTVSQIDHLKYKYLVDVDGNSCSFERYFWALLSNSLVFKQMTPNIQWYYGGLQPYEHFIPVKEDLTDLISQLQWAQNNDETAKQIAKNATSFVKEQLSIEMNFLYMTHLLKEYAKLQKTSKGPS